MRPFVRRAAALAALLVTAACADRSSPIEPGAGTASPPGSPAGVPSSTAGEQSRQERLARRLALALADAEFRRDVYQSLQQSRIREGKVHVQRFLGADQGRRLQRLAQLALESDSSIAEDLAGAAPLEMYLPVPAHRSGWRGDDNILVATALGDHDVPVAFDTRGSRRLLDPVQPPSTPVIAFGRAELDFGTTSGPSGVEVYDEDPKEGEGSGWTGGGAVTSSPGLYMTYSHINS